MSNKAEDKNPAVMDGDTQKMLQKLLAMKKEVAQKQKKLERSRRASRVKAHVRKKIKEHEEMESNFKSDCEGGESAADYGKEKDKIQRQQEDMKANLGSQSNSQTTQSRERVARSNTSSSQDGRTDNLFSSHQLVQQKVARTCQDRNRTKVKDSNAPDNLDTSEKATPQMLGVDSLQNDKHSRKASLCDRRRALSPLDPGKLYLGPNFDSRKGEHVTNSAKECFDSPSRSQHEMKGSFIPDEKVHKKPVSSGREEVKGNSYESMNGNSEETQSTSNQNLSVPLKDGKMSQNRIKDSTPLKFSDYKTKDILKVQICGEKESCVDKRNSWIQSDFEGDQSDFKVFPVRHDEIRKESVEHQDQNGWLSTVRMREVISKRPGHKRNLTRGPEFSKCKVSKRSHTILPKGEAFIKSISSKEPDRKGSKVSITTDSSEKVNEMPNFTHGPTTCESNSSSSFDRFHPHNQLEKSSNPRGEDYEHHLPTVFVAKTISTQLPLESNLLSDSKNTSSQPCSMDSTIQKGQDFTKSSTQKSSPTNSEKDGEITKTSGLDEKSAAAGNKAILTEPALPALQITQESLSLTPSFQTPMCSVRGNYKMDQNVLYQQQVTDSEFFNILGIDQSQEKISSKQSSSYAHMSSENIQAVFHDKSFSKTNATLTAESIEQTKENLSSQDKVKTPVRAEQEDGKKLCSDFGTYLPPSQSASEFSEYTELDSIPFTHLELSEDFLSENSEAWSSNGKSSAGSLVRRRSRRVSVLKPFPHGSPVFSKSEASRTDSESAIHKEVSKYVKGRRQSQAQQRKAAVILSIFQFLRDKAKEPDRGRDFDLTADFDHLKRQKVCEYTNIPNAKTTRSGVDASLSDHLLSSHYNGDDDDDEEEETQSPHMAKNIDSNIQQSLSEKTDHFSFVGSRFCSEKEHVPASLENTMVESELLLTKDKSGSGNLVTEIANVLESVEHEYPLSILRSETRSPTNSDKRDEMAHCHTNREETKIISQSANNSTTNPLNCDADEVQNCRRMSQISSDSHTETNPDKKADSEQLQCETTDKECVVNYEKSKGSVKIDQQFDSNSLQHSENHLSDGTFLENIPCDRSTVTENGGMGDSQPLSKAEGVKDTGDLLPIDYGSSLNFNGRDKSSFHREGITVSSNDPVIQVDGAGDRKSKPKLNLAPLDSASPIICDKNASPQVLEISKNVSSPIQGMKHSFASPTNIINSLLSPVTPSINNATPKGLRSLKRKSISFTSTPIAKSGKGASVLVHKQIEIDFDSPVSKSRSASNASLMAADLPTSPGLNQSQDDLTPVYNKALSVLFSPHTAHGAGIIENKGDKNESIYSQTAPALDISSNLSLVPDCDESYPSPGQMALSDKCAMNLSTNTTLCQSDVVEADERSTSRLSIDRTSNTSRVTLSSPQVVQPWKKLARTATAPVQILEAETTSCEHSSFSFTSNQPRGRNKSDIKSNMKFLGCFQSDSQDAVVSLLCGNFKSPSQPDKCQAYIVSVQATSLTVWGEDDALGWTTELDWRLSPETHILKACLLPGFSRIAVLVTGWLSSSLFASVLTYEWDTEDTMRFNIPFKDLPRQISSLITVEPCPASESQLYLALSSDDHHTVQEVQLLENQKGLASSDLFRCCHGKLLSLVLLEDKSNALVSLTCDQRLTIWNCCLGAPLKTVRVAASMPCLEALISARASMGFVLLESMWRIDDGSCGGLIVMNPLNGQVRVLHTYQVPNNTWRRVDSFKRNGQFISAVSNQGSLCIWDRNSGNLLGSTKSKITTCASISASHRSSIRLLVGEIHGCLHMYSSSSSA